MSYEQISIESKSRAAFGRYYPEKSSLKILIAGQGGRGRRELRNIILAEEDFDIVGESDDGLDTFNKIVRLRPDIAFLDIEMRGLNGFDVIDSLASPPTVIFTSATDQYAVRAFEADALDFLLKPFLADRVRKALARAKRAVAAERGYFDPPATTASKDDWPGASISRVAVHKGKRVLLLSTKDIYYIKVENRLVYIFTEEGQYLINRTITDLEKLLRAEGFFQINRGMIINLNYLCEIVPWFSGTYRLRLTNGGELPLSRDRVSMLKARVGLGRRWSGK